MQTTQSAHLPTEILLVIAEMLWHDEMFDRGGMILMDRQRSFHSFCLVSRQWYSVGISYLYDCPQLWKGNKFAQFTNTVSPPLGVKKSKVDLGSLVKVLHLGSLVHQSSNSQTSRLLGRVKKGLTVFVAPQTGIGVNSLASISKCQNLVHLDLTLARGGAIEFSRLKKTVSNLPDLQTLQLPSSMVITHTNHSAGAWPPKLYSMTIGGSLNPHVMDAFDWPSNLRQLILKRTKNLDIPDFESLLFNDQLLEKLESLTLDNENTNMFSSLDLESTVLYLLRNLTYLKMPLDFAEWLCILPIPNGLSPLSLRVLELTHPYFDNQVRVDFSRELKTALNENLRNIWALGVGETCLKYIKDAYKKIDNEIWKHVEESSDDELDKLAIEDLGIYTIDDDPIV
ncbi:uncharacterized protein N7496_001126 [Penicillium cataractarum]|uniref:F-box domain-containing protein n=1 Tax=Penicillium cataractarum TaxID=2100454 RepID=A0A9W9VVI1_9EURO|nr:uncharacterized protein N7496_001126 [Penicillium cataractarum]KAJ5390058.1 hypothetical protein N7496_001126 [Penicillium cataractarum]